MEINDTVVCGGIKYKVVGKVGAGGQGAVWKVENHKDKQLYALKIIEEKNLYVRMDKVNNIRRIVKEKLEERTNSECARRQVNFAFPMQNYSDPVTGEAGYIMELVSGETLNKMLMTGAIEKMSVNEKLTIVKKIADAIDYLHSIGYCYTDINWGNFMYDRQTGIMHVIDCENIACKTDLKQGKCCFLKGTGFFIAPEVGFGGIVSYASDRYALATLIFRVLTNNYIQSAYHGAAMYTAVPACQNMIEVKDMEEEDDIDKNWRVFIFDEHNRANGIETVYTNPKSPELKDLRRKLDYVIKVWYSLDLRLKELFQLAFEDPFNDGEPTPSSGRPLPSTWVKTIDEILGVKSGRAGHAVKPKAHRANATDAQAEQNGATAASGNTAPAPQPKTVKTKNPYEKYAAFNPPRQTGKKASSVYRPAGNAATVSATPPKPVNLPAKPYLLSSVGVAAAIASDDFTVYGSQVGMPNYSVIGELRKTGDKYEFTSRMLCNMEVHAADGTLKSVISSGKYETLDSGDYLKPVVNTKRLTIVY